MLPLLLCSFLILSHTNSAHVIVVQLPSPVWPFANSWAVACQASLSLISSWSLPCPSSCPLNQCCHPTISSSVTLLSFCLQFCSYVRILTINFIYQVTRHSEVITLFLSGTLSNQFLARNIMETNPQKTNRNSFSSY